MEPELISKKELLEQTGISYGQLYRWKRKDLIPEDWFIRKSTFTGQETFFPKDKMLARIERIMSMKDDLSLDEIADQFSPNPSLTLTVREVIERNIVTKTALDLFLESAPGMRTLSFDQILFVFVLDHLLKSGDINLQEGAVALSCLMEHFVQFAGKPCELFFVRKLGVATCCLLSGSGNLMFDREAKVIAHLNLATFMETLKMKLV